MTTRNHFSFYSVTLKTDVIIPVTSHIQTISIQFFFLSYIERGE
jgi:hypothetical protein